MDIIEITHTTGDLSERKNSGLLLLCVWCSHNCYWNTVSSS